MNRKGMAALLDSMVFLTVAALVSVTLLTANSFTHQVSDVDLQDYVERLNTALIRTTVGLTDERGETSIVSVSNLVVIYILTLARGGNLTLLNHTLGEVENILACLVPPGTEFRWVAKCSSHQLSLGNSPSIPEFKWVSIRSRAMPVLGGELEMKLEIWL